MKTVIQFVVFVALSSVMSLVGASEVLLTKFFKEVDTLKSPFTQSIVDEQGSMIEQTAGLLFLSRPGKFRWDYQSEEEPGERGQQIIADGTNIFIYDPDIDQVTQRSLVNAMTQVPSLSLVSSSEDVNQHFTIKDHGLTDGESWVSLKPKGTEATFQRLMIGFKDKVIRSIVLLDGLGNETRLTLRKVEINKKIDSDRFRFVVPEGADLAKE